MRDLRNKSGFVLKILLNFHFICWYYYYCLLSLSHKFIDHIFGYYSHAEFYHSSGAVAKKLQVVIVHVVIVHVVELQAVTSYIVTRTKNVLVTVLFRFNTPVTP